MKCTGHSKRTGEPCKKDARKGREVCAAHGGKTPVGPAAPNWEHGKYSNYMTTPQKLREGFQRALDDPELTHTTAPRSLSRMP
jgi:hypothetical protein